MKKQNIKENKSRKDNDISEYSIIKDPNEWDENEIYTEEQAKLINNETLKFRCKSRLRKINECIDGLTDEIMDAKFFEINHMEGSTPTNKNGVYKGNGTHTITILINGGAATNITWAKQDIKWKDDYILMPIKLCGDKEIKNLMKQKDCEINQYRESMEEYHKRYNNVLDLLGILIKSENKKEKKTANEKIKTLFENARGYKLK